jgi:photosystem II stability/assembly factor-like uncharacterized protein
MRDPELLTTTDAGISWSVHSIPIPPDVQQLPSYGSLPAETTYWPGIVDAVACTGRGICNVVAQVLNNNSQTAGIIPDTVLFLRTTDGGLTWTSSTLPETSAESGFEVQVPGGNGASLACPTESTCVAVSALAGFNPAQGFVDAWRTTDSGKTWSETQIPGLHQVFSGISCPSAEVCWIPTGASVLRTSDGGVTWSSIPTPPSMGGQTISCTSPRDCLLGGDLMASTSDGGQSWSPVVLPAEVGAVPFVSCEVRGSCIAYARPVQPPGQEFTPNGGSLILTNGPTSRTNGTTSSSQQ